MKTDDLIGLLAADAAPQAPLRPVRIAGVVLAAILAVAGLFLMLAGVRDGLAAALQQPAVLAKTALPLVLAGLAFPMALAQLRPDAGRPRWWGLLPPAMAAAGLWLWGFSVLPPAERFADVSGFAVTECLGLIVTLSILPLAVLIAKMRRGASVAPARAGALAGLAVACGITTGYSLFCTQDNPVFYVTWYGLAILLVTVLGAVLGLRFLRW